MCVMWVFVCVLLLCVLIPPRVFACVECVRQCLRARN